MISKAVTYHTISKFGGQSVFAKKYSETKNDKLYEWQVAGQPAT